MVRALRLSPVDSFSWRNAEKQAEDVESTTYPRYSRKGVAAFLGMRIWAESRAGTAIPMQARVLLIIDDGDPSINGDHRPGPPRPPCR